MKPRMKRLNAIVSDQMHKSLRIALAEDGIDFSSWVRMIIRAYLGKRSSREKSILKRVRQRQLEILNSPKNRKTRGEARRNEIFIQG